MNIVKIFLITGLFLMNVSCKSSYDPSLPLIHTDTLQLFPHFYSHLPDMPSPFQNAEGREFLLAQSNEGNYCFFDVTQENGDRRDVIRGHRGKGNQLKVPVSEIPAIYSNGLHQESELHSVTSISGKSIAQITVDGWPGNASWAGFLCHRENIISLLSADNRLVKEMDLTHWDLARPLFHVWNLIWSYSNLTTSWRKDHITKIFYNGHKIGLEFEGGRGWQTSLFNDSLTGSYRIRLNSLEASSSNLENNFDEVFFSELAPYYIMRYGFYEGHTEYRIDPRAVAMLFSLTTYPKLARSGILPQSSDTITCPNGYIEMIDGWNRFKAVLSLKENDKDGFLQALHQLYQESTDQIRRLCLTEIVKQNQADMALLIAELGGQNWESDTVASNALVKLGPVAIPSLQNLFFDLSADSIARWNALCILYRIGLTEPQKILVEAEQDQTWIIRKEAAYIRQEMANSVR